MEERIVKQEKYAKGDIVRVRADLQLGRDYHGRFGHDCAFVRGMEKFCGKDVEISAVNERTYYIKNDPGQWHWVEEMFEGKVIGGHELQVGDSVTISTSYHYKPIAGKVGKVVGIDGDTISVEFSENIGGHDCDGLCKYGHGRRVSRSFITITEAAPEVKRDFKVGDRIRVYDVSDVDAKVRGKIGTVVDTDSYSLAISFDDDVDGHTCSNRCKDGHGWNVVKKYVELLTKEARKPKYKIGDKVAVVNKTVPGFVWTPAEIQSQKAKHPFMYVTKVYATVEQKQAAASMAKNHPRVLDDEPIYSLHPDKGVPGGNFYFESDVTPYVEATLVEPRKDFVVGNKVKVKPDAEVNSTVKGKTGTIVEVDHDHDIIGIKFDEYISGHSCKGTCEYGYGWNVGFADIELCETKTEPKVETVLSPKCTFKVGDIVTGKPDSHREYTLTNEDMKRGTVVTVYGENKMRVRIDDHDASRHEGEEYDVNPKYFNLVEAASLPIGIKLTEAKPGHKFKVGDIVKGNNQSDKAYGITNSLMTKAKVTDVAADDTYVILTILEHKAGEKGGNFRVRPEYLDLITEETPSYRIGDRVVCNNAQYANVAGKAGVIRNIYKEGIVDVYSIEFDEDVRGHECKRDGKAYAKIPYGWNVRIQSIEGLAKDVVKAELVKKESVKAMPKFKVGDKVKLSCDREPRYSYGRVRQGDIGTISKLNDPCGRGNVPAYLINFPAQESWVGSEDELVLVTETPAFKLIAREVVAPGISAAVQVAAEEDPFEWEEIEAECYEEDPCEGCTDGECEGCEYYETDYEPCILGTVSLVPEITGITRRDTMEGITLRESGNPFGGTPARGIFPSAKIERKTGGIMKAFGNIFGANIGKDNSGKLALTIAGIAVRNNEGKFVAYKDGALVDVMDAKFDVDNAFYRIPTTDVKANDIIINQSGVPVIVIKAEKDGLTVVNPYNGLQEKIVPSTNLLNMKFYVKVISLFGDMFKGIDLSNPQSVLPFVLMSEGGSEDLLPLMLMAGGNKDMNSMLPLLMLSGKGGDMGDMLPFLLMGQNGGTDMNAMLPFLLMGKGGKGGDMMETMLMMQAFGGKGFNLFGAPAATETAADAE